MKNFIFNALKGRNLIVMIRKLVKRLEVNNSVLALQWAKNNSNISTEALCKSIDENLFQIVKQDIIDIEIKAHNKLEKLGLNLGGGGNYLLLYFLVRKFKPKNIVETGVAAGWTSLAMLEALDKNGHGDLYSSDFPYFRLENPEQYIGFVVQPSNLKKRWHLDIRGDEIALPKISASLGELKVNLFHYDSCKSYSGRKFALRTLKRNLASDCIVIFDDIQDNLHFKDLVKNSGVNYKVLEFQGKYVGIIGI
ncbi:class I SAM-dependent methyltransferase [Amylibacter sp.]|nr:class I SAM-dependent methyltransferase [Amylibacter sp.]